MNQQQLKARNWNEHVTKVLCDIVLLFAMICLAQVCWNRLFTRAFMALNNTVGDENAEHVRFYSLNPIKQFLMIAVALAVLLFIALLIKGGLKGKGKTIITKLPYICAAAVFVLGMIYIVIIQYIPLADSGSCCEAAMQMINQEGLPYYDVNLLVENGLPYGYVAAFPYQLGYVLFVEIVFRIFGSNNVMALQIINLLLICFGQLLLSMIAKKIAGAKYAELVGAVTSVLTFLFLPWVMYTIFCYGNMPSLTFVLAACFSLCCFCEKPSVKSGACLVLCSTIAMLLKASALIPLIAFAIVLILMAIHRRNAKILILVVFLLIPYQASNVVTAVSEVRCGMPLAPGTPMNVYLAMGLEDTGPFQAGGYNGRSSDAYRQNGADYDATSREQIEVIKERLKVFAADHDYAVQFFSDKINSQWLDPSFGSVFIGWACTSNPKNVLATWEELYNPIGTLWNIQNAIQWCLFLLALQWGVLAWKKITPEQLPLYLTFLGGFLYLIISESKAQYAISYYILLLPYAACALAADATYISRRLQKIKLTQKEMPDGNQ